MKASLWTSALTVALFVGGAGLTIAQGQETVYRWTDKQGVTHYSQSPPEGVEYEERKIDSREAETEAEAAPQPPPQDAQAARAQLCATARRNLEILQTAEQVRIARPPPPAPLREDGTTAAEGEQDEPAEPETLDEEARAKEIARAEEQIRQFCDD